MQKKFPQLLTMMLDFINFMVLLPAQGRSGTSITCGASSTGGVRLEDMQQRVLKNVAKISKSKIHYLLKPANEKSAHDSARHKTIWMFVLV